MVSLHHILASDPDESPVSTVRAPVHSHLPIAPMPTLSQDKKLDHIDNDRAATPKHEAEPTGSEAGGAVKRSGTAAGPSVYSGNRMRHLKKEDGIPLWRKDIQYDFLDLVFHDQRRCFTKYSDATSGNTFAEIYIDAMAKSSKCSKILKDKLLQDQDSAIHMAMVCLLVNIGRMNTTLNFFPEMRAQLRTYHPIPALQAYQDANAYKQLQDAPRLKSILKGANDDEPQPNTIEDLKTIPKPRTTPVNLIFIMHQYAPKISELHFPAPRDFFDLIMRNSLSSASRARAFLWLMWWYLESNFSLEDSQRNPFGEGQFGEGEEGTGILPLKVPHLDSLTEEQALLENIDPEMERTFGEQKRKERLAILANEPSPATSAPKRGRKEKHSANGHNWPMSDDEGSEAGRNKTGESRLQNRGMLSGDNASEYGRSPSPTGSLSHKSADLVVPGDTQASRSLLDDDVAHHPFTYHQQPTAASPAKKGPGRGNWRRNRGKTDLSAFNNARTTQDGSHHVHILPSNFIGDGLQSSGNVNMRLSHVLGSQAESSPNQMLTPALQQPTGRDHIPTPSYQVQKRHRGVTQHQSAVISHRKHQIDYTLDRRIRNLHVLAREKRENESAIVRAWKRVRLMPVDYDSEEETFRARKARDREFGELTEWRMTGGGASHSLKKESTGTNGQNIDDFLENMDLWRRPRTLYAGFARAGHEVADIGEEVRTLARSLRRCSRRLERWQETNSPAIAVLNRLQLQAQGIPTLQEKPQLDTKEDEVRGEVKANNFWAGITDKDDSMMDLDPPSLARKSEMTGHIGNLVGQGSKRRGPGGGAKSKRGDRKGPGTATNSNILPGHKSKGHKRKTKAGRENGMIRNNEDDEDVGAGELDEEDRELLGEVDPDVDESEGGYDVDGDGDLDGDGEDMDVDG